MCLVALLTLYFQCLRILVNEKMSPCSTLCIMLCAGLSALFLSSCSFLARISTFVSISGADSKLKDLEDSAKVILSCIFK